MTKRKDYTWIPAKGKAISISDMHDSHLRNTMMFLYRQEAGNLEVIKNGLKVIAPYTGKQTKKLLKKDYNKLITKQSFSNLLKAMARELYARGLGSHIPATLANKIPKKPKSKIL